MLVSKTEEVSIIIIIVTIIRESLCCSVSSIVYLTGSLAEDTQRSDSSAYGIDLCVYRR